jgi:DNA invertase Pin-like site-specific DNA recombinase
MDTGGMRPIDIYARVSLLKKDKRIPSTDGQAKVCRARLEEKGLPVGETLVDPGRSAWNPNVKRPAWDELMNRLETGISGGFITYDLERYTRRPPDAERMIEVAARGLLVLDSESEYDLTTPNGKKSFRDAITAAAYYSDRLSTRASRGLRDRAIDGTPLGTAKRFGFQADRVTHVEDEAEIIREVTRRLLAGETRLDLVKELNERGIRGSLGKPWSMTSLKAMVTRPVNCGRIAITDKDTGELVTVGHLPGEPIVSEEDFDRRQAMFAARRRGRPNSPRYLCSGHVVCADCINKKDGGRHAMHGHPRTDLGAYPDGERPKRSYHCVKAVGGCQKNEIDQRALDKAAEALVIEILSDPENTTAIETAARQAADERSRLDQEIAEAEEIAEEIAGRLGRQEITLKRHDAAVKPLDARIARLTAERAALPDPDPSTVTPEQLEASREQWQQRWDTATHEERRGYLKLALQGQEIVVEPPERGRGSTDPAEIIKRIKIRPPLTGQGEAPGADARLRGPVPLCAALLCTGVGTGLLHAGIRPHRQLGHRSNPRLSQRRQRRSHPPSPLSDYLLRGRLGGGRGRGAGGVGCVSGCLALGLFAADVARRRIKGTAGMTRGTSCVSSLYVPCPGSSSFSPLSTRPGPCRR